MCQWSTRWNKEQLVVALADPWNCTQAVIVAAELKLPADTEVSEDKTML